MKQISRQAAKLERLARYFTGKPCAKGHITQRLVSNFSCVKCKNEHPVLYRQRYPDRMRAATAKHRKLHGLQWKSYNKNSRLKLKEYVIVALGGKCACCKEKNLVFLCVDHKNKNGAAHRRLVGHSQVYRRIRDLIHEHGAQTARKEYRVLCWNCNSAIHLLGVCPHAVAS